MQIAAPTYPADAKRVEAAQKDPATAHADARRGDLIDRMHKIEIKSTGTTTTGRRSNKSYPTRESEMKAYGAKEPEYLYVGFTVL